MNTTKVTPATPPKFSADGIDDANRGINSKADALRQPVPHSSVEVGQFDIRSNSSADSDVCGEDEGLIEKPKESPEEKIESIRAAMTGSDDDVFTVLEEGSDGYHDTMFDILSVHRTFDGAFRSVTEAVIDNSWADRRSNYPIVTPHSIDASRVASRKEKEKKRVIRRASLGEGCVTVEFDGSTSGNEGDATYTIRRQKLQD